jgi:hypothetical protein
MPTARACLGATEFDGLIYAIGGAKGWTGALNTLNVVEKYTISEAVAFNTKIFSSDMIRFATVGHQLPQCSKNVGVCPSLSSVALCTRSEERIRGSEEVF